MDDLSDDLSRKVADFIDYVTELTKWVTEEKKDFPYTKRLLECGTGIRDSLRMEETAPGCSRDSCVQAVSLAEEFRGLMTLMVKSGVLTEIQSKPLLSYCEYLVEKIVGMTEGNHEIRAKEPF